MPLAHDASKSRRYLALVVLFALVCGAYASTLDNPFLYDDVPLVLQNPQIRSLPTLGASYLDDPQILLDTRWPRMVVYAAIYELVGPDPALYHATNIVLHFVVCLLAYLLIARISGDRALAWLSAAIFGLHPIATDVVAPVSGLRGILAAAFGLGALLLMERFRRGQGLRFFLYAIFTLYLSAFSKEVGFMMIPAFFLIEIYRRRGDEASRSRDPFPLLTRLRSMAQVIWTEYRIAALAVCGIGAVSALLVAPLLADLPGQSYYDATGQSLTVFDRVRLVGTALRLLILPVGQSVDYFYDSLQLTNPAVTAIEVLDVCVLLGASALALNGLRRLSWAGFGGAWFLIMSLPTIGILPYHEVFAERFLYLPSLGFAIAVSAGLLHLARTPRWERPVAFASCALLLALGTATALRNQVWNSELALYENAVARYPGSVRARKGLAHAYRAAGEPELALHQYQEAARILPSYPAARIGAVEVLLATGRLAQADEQLREILRMWPEDADAWTSLGSLHDDRGELIDAERAYGRAVELNPRHAVAFNNLGRLRAMRQDLRGAVKLFEQSLAIDPANRDALNNLAVVYRHAFRDTERAAMLEERIRRLGTTVQ